MQYCRIGDHWAAESEFYDERKGYHGNRDWCKYHTSEYCRKRNLARKKLLRKLIRFWNKHHPNNQIPVPK